jgi:predicted amidohydrolase
MLVGAAQIDMSLGKKTANLEKCIHYLKTARRENIELLVFPECTITGYIFNSFEEALRISEEIPGETTRIVSEACSQHRMTTVVGLLEHRNGKLYNTAVLIGPKGLLGVYRKTHTPFLGVDRFVSPGEQLPVFKLPDARVGILICYDLRFPEPSRVMALKRVQVVCNPTNLPKGVDVYAAFFNRSRACENRISVISANRVGRERGFSFIGRSQIIDSSGRVLAEAGDIEQIIKAEIRPEEADNKHVVKIPGEHETDVFRDRRPELYKEITEPP